MGHLRGRPPGLTLLEVIVTVALFTLVTTILTLAIRQSSEIYRYLNSQTEAQTSLRKAEILLDQDLRSTSFAALATAVVPDHLGGGGMDGQALWFRSPRGSDGVVCHRDDGTPFWQKNVLYYLVVPANHDEIAGSSCAGGVGPGGLDDRCPHKVLIRKVIDVPPATDPADEATEEPLISDITPYLTQPSGYDTSAMLAEAGVEEVEIVARRLLYFAVKTAPDPGNWPTEVEVDLRAVSIQEAERAVPVGSTALGTGQFTTSLVFSVFPPNP